jgi:hypothetical protein
MNKPEWVGGERASETTCHQRQKSLNRVGDSSV